MLSKKISLLVLPLVTMVSLQANDPFFNDPFGDDIFKEMYQMQKEMDKIFERMQQRMEQRTQRLYIPTRQSLMNNYGMRKMSLFEDKGSYYEYNTQIPEDKNNQIDVNIENNMLHIKARVEQVKKANNNSMHSEQRMMRMFQSSETLPTDVDVNSLKGEYKGGYFVLTLQKKKQTTHPSVTKPSTSPAADKQKVEKKEKTEEKKETNTTTHIKVPETSTNA